MAILTLATSDGTESNWPAGWLPNAVPINSNNNYYEKVYAGHVKHTLFLQKIGQHLAVALGYNDPLSYQLTDLPAGYSLFLHHKLQANGSDRSDIYLYGSKFVTKFRSPAEFFGHAEWLHKGNVKDHSTCTCKYSGNYSAPGPSASGISKRPAQTAGPSSSRPVKKIKSSDEEKLENHALLLRMTMVESRKDLISDEWFRRGELVWAKIPTIKPNPDQANTTGIDQIDYWPGVIVEAGVKVQPGEEGEEAKEEILQSTQYEVRYCGHLDPEEAKRTRPSTGIVDENDVLPWHFLPPKLPDLAAIIQKYNLAIAEASMSLKPGESAEEKRVETWRKGTTGRIWPIAEATQPENWEQIAVVYAHAVNFAMDLSTVWCQTDGYGGQDDIATHLVAEQTTYFQGLWWGAERIWRGDTVRLSRSRTAMHSDRLKAASPGAEDRTPFMRISAISLHEFNREASSKFHCVIVGDLYELADAAWVAENEPAEEGQERGTEVAATDSAGIDMEDVDTPIPMPKTAEGFVWRRISPAACEVTCDIFDIAGRAYTTLPESPMIRTIQDGSYAGPLSNQQDVIKTRLDALMGLVQVGDVMTKVKKWQDKRYNSVLHSHMAANKWLSGLFEGPTPIVPNGMVTGNTKGSGMAVDPVANGVTTSA